MIFKNYLLIQIILYVYIDINFNSIDKPSSGRSYTTTSVDPNIPNYMNQMFAHNNKPIDLLHIIPVVLLVAIIPIILPLIFQLFAGLFTPMNFTHGKRKRDTNFSSNEELNKLLVSLMQKFVTSLDKYSH